MTMPRIDWTISIGTVAQIAVVAFGLLKIYNTIEHRLGSLETKMEPMWEWFTENLMSAHRKDRP